MNGLDLRVAAGDVPVDADAQVADLGIRFVLPGGIRARPGARGVHQAGQSLHPAGEVLPNRVDAASHRDRDLDGLARLLEHAQVQAAFHETFEVFAHGLNAVGGDHQEVDEPLRGCAVKLPCDLAGRRRDHRCGGIHR